MKSVCFFLLIAILSPALFAGDSTNIQILSDKIRQFEDYPADSCREIILDHEIIDLVQARLTLSSGLMYLTGYVNNRPTVAYFQGEGVLEYFPPDKVETRQVNRFYFTDSIAFEFDEAYLTFPEQSRVLRRFHDSGIVKKMPSRVRGMSKAMKKIPGSHFNYNLPLDMYRATVENQSEFLWINTRHKRFNSTVYLYNPYDAEQVSIYKYAGNFKKAQLVSSMADTDAGIMHPVGGAFNVFSYDIDLDVNTTGMSSMNCTMNIEIICDSLKLVCLDFPEQFEIDSVSGNFNDSLSFVHEEKHPNLAIELPEYYRAGDTVSIIVWYRGNLFRQYVGWGVVHEFLTRWYPYNGFRQLSEYNVRYKIDNGLTFLAVGNKLSDSISGGYRYLEYQSPGPIAYVTFNYGAFDSTAVDGSPVPIGIYSLPGDKSSIFGFGGLDDVADDIGGSLRFFSEYIAPYPFDRLIVDAMSTSHGQGSPGMVHLSEITFRRDTEGLDDKFRAHEVAHQWWGHLVGPKSYHDLWLSEGLAEYSAALYIEQYKKNKDTFRDILKNWRKNILQKGMLHGKKSDGYRAGAIYLGSRLLGESSPGDYEALVYFKAAYMLHMLRMELSILENGGRDLFQELISGFAHKYSGELVTTNDFIEETRKYLGKRTDQFFDQWLYDWRVPRVKKDWKRLDNNYVELMLSIADVENKFLTSYPVEFIMDDGTTVTEYYNLSFGENRFEYQPPDNLNVKSVSFNPEQDILEK